jgi:hypothetical protein
MRQILVLHYTPRPRAVRLTTEQHLDAVTAIRGARVLSYNAVNAAPSWLRHLRFDAVVLHTTLLCMRWNVLFPAWRPGLDWLADVDCLKIAMPQDEYDRAHVLDEWLDDLGVSVVCTVLDDRHRIELYPRLHRKAVFQEILTGYIDEQAAERFRARVRPTAERILDVVYRARHLPYWYGSHAQLKHRIGDAALARAGRHDLRCDISTRAPETILGDAWLDFLARGRATVGTESGASVLDRRGEAQKRVTAILEDEPGLSFEEVSSRMPPGWDDYRFFAISPRHLEAVVTKTAQILVEGRYSGVLKPERHYIPVQSDLSDLDDGLERARDPRLLQELADQAYRDVYESGVCASRRLTETLERIVAEHAVPRGGVPGRVFRSAKRLAALQSDAERTIVAPAANVTRVGRDGIREMLAGLRLVARDTEARTLLLDYLGSTQTREHVSPRQALADLLCLGAVRRAHRRKFDGAQPFKVLAELDEKERRLLLRSVPHGAAADDRGGCPSAERLEDLLNAAAVDFVWDHSRVGRSVSFPLAGSRSLRFELPAGPHPLPLLNWLARQRPSHVTAALAPILGRSS